jgi:hypothetical protein
MRKLDELLTAAGKAVFRSVTFSHEGRTCFESQSLEAAQNSLKGPLVIALALQELTAAVENLTHVTASMAQIQKQALDMALRDKDLKS